MNVVEIDYLMIKLDCLDNLEYLCTFFKPKNEKNYRQAYTSIKEHDYSKIFDSENHTILIGEDYKLKLTDSLYQKAWLEVCSYLNFQFLASRNERLKPFLEKFERMYTLKFENNNERW